MQAGKKYIIKDMALVAFDLQCLTNVWRKSLFIAMKKLNDFLLLLLLSKAISKYYSGHSLSFISD